jgi:hypothetical protein
MPWFAYFAYYSFVKRHNPCAALRRWLLVERGFLTIGDLLEASA